MLFIVLLACESEAPAPAPSPAVPAAPAAPPAPKAPAVADLPHEGDVGADRSPGFLMLQGVQGDCGLVVHRVLSGAHVGLVGLPGPCPTQRAGLALNADGSRALIWGEAPDTLWDVSLAAPSATPLPIPKGTTPLWMGYTRDGGIALFTQVKADLTRSGPTTSLTLEGQTYEIKDPPNPPGDLAILGWKRAPGASDWAFSAVGEADTRTDRYRRVPGLTLPLFGELAERPLPDRWVCPVGAKADAAEARALRGKETSKAGFWQDVPADCPAAMWVADGADGACPNAAAVWSKDKSGWGSRVSLAPGAVPSSVRTVGPRTLVEEAGAMRVVDLCGGTPERRVEGAYVGIWPVRIPIPGVTVAGAGAPAGAAAAPADAAPAGAPPAGTAAAGAAPATGAPAKPANP